MPQPLKNEQRNGAAAALAEMAGGGVAVAEKDVPLSEVARRFLSGSDLGGDGALDGPANPHRQVLWANRCINTVANTMAGIPLRLVRAAAGSGLKLTKGFRADFRAVRRGGYLTADPQSTLRAVKGARGVVVGRAAEGEYVESGQAWQLLGRPNNYSDGMVHNIRATAGHLQACGSVAWVLGQMAGRRPGEIHVIGRNRVTPVVDRDGGGLPFLRGYRYRPPGSGRDQALAPDEVKYWHLWSDHDNPLDGLSPSVPGRLALATDYNASLFNASALANGCEIGTAFSFPGGLTPDQREEFELALRRRYQGAGKARKPIVMEGGGTVESTGASLRDMEHHLTKTTTRLEIAALYGVPPVVAGWVESAGDSSAYAQHALAQFYEQTIFSFADAMLPAIQEIVSRIDPGLIAVWDLEDQPVVQKMRLARTDAAKKYFDMGWPANRIDEVLDLGMGPTPWGDMGVLPMSLAPAVEVVGGMAGVDGAPEGGGDDDDRLGQEEAIADCGLRIADCPDAGPRAADAAHRGAGSPRDHAHDGRDRSSGGHDSAIRNPQSAIDAKTAEAVWRRWAASWSPLARTLRNVLRTRYLKQQTLALAALREALGSPGASQLQIANCKLQIEKDPDVIRRVLLHAFPNDPGFKSRMRAFITDANELGVRQALVEAGLEGEDLAEAMRRIMSDPAITAAIQHESIIVSTKIDAMTRKLLRGQLAEGLNAGEDIRLLADRIQAVMGNRRKAAMVVARNAVGQALSDSRHVAQKAAGMTHKAWLHSRGPGERRAAHVRAEGVYGPGKAIAIAEPFIVDGESLMYPRDHRNGSPGNTINCQCISIGSRAKTPKGAGEALCKLAARLAAGGFETYASMIAARKTATDGNGSSADSADGADEEKK